MIETQIFNSYFFLRLFLNTITMALLLEVIYFRVYRCRSLFFTFYLLNFMVFLLVFMLEKMKAFNTLGSAFGLLAAFSLLRFRTEQLTAQDMTYLFITMALGLINSIINGSYLDIILLNLMILAAIYITDGIRRSRTIKSKTIEYNKLDNLHPTRHKELTKELKELTGLDIQNISLDDINTMKGSVSVNIYYY